MPNYLSDEEYKLKYKNISSEEALEAAFLNMQTNN